VVRSEPISLSLLSKILRANKTSTNNKNAGEYLNKALFLQSINHTACKERRKLIVEAYSKARISPRHTQYSLYHNVQASLFFLLLVVVLSVVVEAFKGARPVVRSFQVTNDSVSATLTSS